MRRTTSKKIWKKRIREDDNLKLRPSFFKCYFFLYSIASWVLQRDFPSSRATECRLITLSEEYNSEHSNTTYVSISQSAPTTVSSLCEVLHCRWCFICVLSLRDHSVPELLNVHYFDLLKLQLNPLAGARHWLCLTKASALTFETKRIAALMS